MAELLPVFCRNLKMYPFRKCFTSSLSFPRDSSWKKCLNRSSMFKTTLSVLGHMKFFCILSVNCGFYSWTPHYQLTEIESRLLSQLCCGHWSLPSIVECPKYKCTLNFEVTLKLMTIPLTVQSMSGSDWGASRAQKVSAAALCGPIDPK